MLARPLQSGRGSQRTSGKRRRMASSKSHGRFVAHSTITRALSGCGRWGAEQEGERRGGRGQTFVVQMREIRGEQRGREGGGAQSHTHCLNAKDGGPEKQRDGAGEGPGGASQHMHSFWGGRIDEAFSTSSAKPLSRGQGASSTVSCPKRPPLLPHVRHPLTISAEAHPKGT